MHGLTIPWWVYAAFVFSLVMLGIGAVAPMFDESPRTALRLALYIGWLVIWAVLSLALGGLLWIFGGLA